MGQFLLACWSFETHSDVFLAVGSALRKQGHDVAFYTAPRDRERVEAIGARLFPFNRLSQEQADYLVDGVLYYRKRPWMLWQWWRRFLLQTIPAQVQDLTDILTKYRADAIVADTALWSLPVVVRETTNIPVAMLSHVGLCLEPGDAGPVHGRAMPPRRTAFQRLLANAIQSLSAYASRDARRTASRIRAAYGLPPVTGRVTALLSKMELYLIPTCPSFDYSRSDLPPSVKYIGPCLWPESSKDSSRPELRDASPRVVVEEGSLYAQDPILLRAAMSGLAGSRAKVTVYGGKGRDLASLGAGELAPNITIRPWQPLVNVVAGADLVLTNGNTDSTMAALSRGIPIIVVPSILDQAEVAMRVSVSGAGITIKEGHCTPAKLRAGVDRLLAEPSYRREAARLAVELNALDGPRLAVRFLEELVRQRYAAA